MPDATDHLLNARQMALFVQQGYLRFDGLVAPAMNAACMQEIIDERIAGVRYNNEHLDFDAFFAASPGYAAVLQLPAVQGLIHSLVGPDPHIDHTAVHTTQGPYGQFWHADATIDPRTEAFDIQLFYFPHDTPLEAGGTLFLPGSHFRRVHESTIARYQNIRGQVHMVCPAGTVVVAHHNIWHCGQPNTSGKIRYMLKLRLNARYRQQGLFRMDDLEHPDVAHILGRHLAWMGAENRLEILQRLRLWRALTGTPADADLWLHRLENEPTRRLIPAPAPALAR